MEKTHISQVYPCSEVSFACELYYICELGKYFKYNYGRQLSLDGVILDKHLRKASHVWDYFRMAVDEGWVCDTGLSNFDVEITVQNPIQATTKQVLNVLMTCEEVSYDAEDNVKRRNSQSYNFRTPKLAQISFSSKSDDTWIWNIKGENEQNFSVNNNSVNSSLAKQAWLSLVAFVAVERVMTGKPDTLVLSFNMSIASNDMALSYLTLLFEKSNCFYGWVYLHYDESVPAKTKLHIEYLAWYANGVDLGMLETFYSAKQKLDYMDKKDIKVGDIVFLYERDMIQKLNFVKTISGCHFCIVRQINKNSVTLQSCNTVKTYCQGKYDFDNNTTIVKQMWIESKPYEKFNSSIKTFDLNDLGVSYMMRSEKYLMLSLDETADERITCIKEDGEIKWVNLPQNDFIYWVLKDYNIEFNEEKFLSTYFRDSKPLKQLYDDGESLPEKYYLSQEEE